MKGTNPKAKLIIKKTKQAPTETPQFSLKLESASDFNSEIDFIFYDLKSNAKIINSF